MAFNYREEMYFLNHTAAFYLFDVFIFCSTSCEDYCIVTRQWGLDSKAVLQEGAQKWELLVLLDLLMCRIDLFSKRVQHCFKIKVTCCMFPAPQDSSNSLGGKSWN